MINILIAVEDNHLRQMIYSAVGQAHDMTVVADTDDMFSILNMVDCLQPNMLLLEINSLMPQHLEMLEKVHHQYPQCKTIMFSSSPIEDVLMMKAFVTGLAGHIEKQAELSISTLLNLIRTVKKGGTILSPHLMKVVVDELFNEHKASYPFS